MNINFFFYQGRRNNIRHNGILKICDYLMYLPIHYYRYYHYYYYCYETFIICIVTTKYMYIYRYVNF